MNSTAPVTLARPTGPRHAARPSSNNLAQGGAPAAGHWVRDVGAVAIFCVLAVVVYGDVWRAGIQNVYVGETDNLQTMWFLNWVPYAIEHGLNPFHSALVNVPFGVNLLDQTSVLLLGLLLAPITVLFGPAASLAVGFTLALAGSAISMYFVVRRFTIWRPAAFVAGLVYGFGPYEIRQGTAHLHMACAVLPPLILLLLYDITVKSDGKARRRGIVLALLLVAQFFISLEMLLETVVIGAVMLAALALFRRSRERIDRHALATGLGWCCGLVTALLVYPVWYTLAGPEHIRGAFHNAAYYRADLLGTFVPDGLQKIAPTSLATTANSFAGNRVENGSYLGLTLLAVLAVGAVWLWRRTAVRVAVVVGATAFVFSLGSRLVVRAAPGVTANGAATGSLPLPWAVMGHLPLFGDVLPVRFTLFVDMAAAVVLAVVLDHLHAPVLRRGHPVVAVVAPLGVAAIALLPLLPAVPFGFVNNVPQTRYFTSPAVQDLPAGQVAIVYPFPSGNEPQGMLWQTQAGMRFSMPGGYFLVPQGRGGSIADTWYAYNDYRSELSSDLSRLSAGVPVPHTAAARRAMRQELASWHVRSAVAVPAPGTDAQAVAYLSWVFGASPTRRSGAYVWTHLGRTADPNS
jgi:hypothetical protein